MFTYLRGLLAGRYRHLHGGRWPVGQGRDGERRVLSAQRLRRVRLQGAGVQRLLSAERDQST